MSEQRFGRAAPTLGVSDMERARVDGFAGAAHNVAHRMVDDATALFDHRVANAVTIVKGVRDADYGLRGFVFADPDGNRIDVGQRLD